MIALQSIQNRGPQIDLLTDSTQVEKNIIQLFQQQNQVFAGKDSPREHLQLPSYNDD